MAGPCIALAVDRASAFGRELILGLLPVAHRLGWVLELVDLHDPPLGRSLGALRPDGAVVMISSPAQVSACARLKAVVNVGHVLPGRQLPHVGNDDRAIGAVAARHLIERGRRRLIAVGVAGRRMDELRIAGFRQASAEAGCGCQAVDATDLARQLPAAADGPGQVGIFAISDGLGVRVLSQLSGLGVAVPDQAALVAVDNDDICCRLARPEMSSVAVARREIGQAAGEMLADLLAGRAAAPVRFIAPLGLVVRASSDHWAIPDPDLAAACRVIRARAHQHLSPEDVVRAVPLSRSTLQRRFREAFGQTLREAIRGARLDRARKLLIDSDQKLAAIARGAGFANAAQLVHQFRAAEGMTPEAWRRRLRNG